VVRLAAIVLAVALVVVTPAWAAKPPPPRGAYTCFVIDIIVGPDGTPVAGPTGSVIGTLRLRKHRYRSKLGVGTWRYIRKRSKPRFRSGPLKGLRVTWDPRPEDEVWRIELQYKGERHFCDKPRRAGPSRRRP
jgi:hypothetical protein